MKLRLDVGTGHDRGLDLLPDSSLRLTPTVLIGAGGALPAREPIDQG